MCCHVLSRALVCQLQWVVVVDSLGWAQGESRGRGRGGVGGGVEVEVEVDVELFEEIKREKIL